jgi:predicted ATPase/transcriptional regulator with XRE-family HTH domain
MDEPLSFGVWLKRRRKGLDLTQNELAEQLGCSLSTIVKIEAEQRRPSRQIAGLLATILQIPEDQRAVFIKMARGERRFEGLPPVPGAHGIPPQQPTGSLPSGIPTPPNPLVGREAERHEVVRLLIDPACRLLTLTGPGGIGKTRLAKEVGLEILRRSDNPFPDGLYWVPLASVHSASYLAPAIAQALGVVNSGLVDLVGQIVITLRERQALLLLDNLEHLLECVDLLSELLQEAPGIKMLATSQVRLNLSSEWVFNIQGLPFPSADEVEQLDQYGAVRLFLNYARQVRGNYEPSYAEYQTIAQICRLLEGMPLAIQLAAGWGRVLSPMEILQELERSTQAGEAPDFLADAARDIPERHRSLQAAFDYSWHLLDEHERRFLCRLSVFEGGFQREAAEQVAGLSLSALAGLMDKSLVLRVDHGRFSLHDLVHKYGFVKLKENPEEMQATLEKHCRYYGDLLRPIVNRQEGRSRAELQAMTSFEADNFRQAWDYALKNKRTREIQHLSQGFTWLYELRGWYQEGLEVFKQAVAALSDLENAPESLTGAEKLSLAAVLMGYGWFLNRHGHNSPAREYFMRALNLLRTAESPESLANVLRFIGNLDLQVGEYRQARTYLEESLRICQSVRYTYGLGVCYTHLGMLDNVEGKFQEALRGFEAALELWEQLQEPTGVSYCLRYLRQTALALDASNVQYLDAREKIQEALLLSRENDDASATGTTLNHLGVLAYLDGDFGTAAAYFREAAVFFQRIGVPHSLAQSNAYLGLSLTHQGCETEARQAFIDGFENARESEAMPYMLETLVGLARLSQLHEDPRLLRQLVDLVISHPAAMFETRQSASQLRQSILDRELTGVEIGEQPENDSLSLEQIAQHLMTQPGCSL